MKYGKLLFVTGIFLLSLVFMTGCSDYVGKEKTHPLFVKAGASRSAGNYKEAAQFYEDFLYVCPKSSLAHLELAKVYGDNLDDPFRAMYHYEKYLELVPTSPDAGDVKKFSDACRKRVFEKLSKDYTSLDASKAQMDAARYKKRMEEYVEYSRKLREQNERMKQMIRSGNVTREVSVRPLRTNEKTVSENQNTEQQATVTEQTAPAEKPKKTVKKPVPQGNREYVVVSGDTLSKISKKMYGTTRHWRRIKEANPGKVNANNGIRIGATLTIPAIGGAR